MSQAARRSLSVLLGVLLLSGLLAVASPAFAGKGASKKCHKGGWKNYQTTEGTTFANQKACVKYVNKGGKLVTPPPAPENLKVTSLGLSAPDDPQCPVETIPAGCFIVELDGFGLEPGTYTHFWWTFEGTHARYASINNDADGTTFGNPYRSYILCGVTVEGPIYATSVLASGEPIKSNEITTVPC